jgi:WbqC-like protein family
MKTIAIHQPNYLPWPGYFYKMLTCDDFVFLDDVVMATRSFSNRNRVKTKNGVLWLTVPCNYVWGETLIRDVTIAGDKWRKKHLRTLEESYRKAPYLNDYMPRLTEIILANEAGICDLNIRLIKQIAEWLDISCSFHMSSALEVSSKADDRIIDLVKRLQGSAYLSGHGGANYQTEDKFKEQEIDLIYYSFKPPTYPQLWGNFESGLSVIDLLFNCGPDSRGILENSALLANKFN